MTVTADKCLLNEKVGEDKAGKPIIAIWHDENGKVARFNPGTIFTVNAEPVFGTGMIKFWQLLQARILRPRRRMQ